MGEKKTLQNQKKKRKKPGLEKPGSPPLLVNVGGSRSDSDAMFLECEFARGSTSWSLGNTASVPKLPGEGTTKTYIVFSRWASKKHTENS